MSRHRNVRSLNYEEECDGYDDVYGHSVEEDFCVSPSTAAEFMYDRSQQQQHVLSTFMKKEHEPNIPEEECEVDIDESPLQDSSSFIKPALNDIEQAQLYSCLEELRSVLGDNIPEHILIDAVLKANFDHEKALNSILCQQEAPKPQREPRKKRDRDDYNSLNSSPSPDSILTKPLASSCVCEKLNDSPQSTCCACGVLQTVVLDKSPSIESQRSGTLVLNLSEKDYNMHASDHPEQSTVLSPGVLTKQLSLDLTTDTGSGKYGPASDRTQKSKMQMCELVSPTSGGNRDSYLFSKPSSTSDFASRVQTSEIMASDLGCTAIQFNVASSPPLGQSDDKLLGSSTPRLSCVELKTNSTAGDKSPGKSRVTDVIIAHKGLLHSELVDYKATKTRVIREELDVRNSDLLSRSILLSSSDTECSPPTQSRSSPRFNNLPSFKATCKSSSDINTSSKLVSLSQLASDCGNPPNSSSSAKFASLSQLAADRMPLPKCGSMSEPIMLSHPATCYENPPNSCSKKTTELSDLKIDCATPPNSGSLSKPIGLSQLAADCKNSPNSKSSSKPISLSHLAADWGNPPGADPSSKTLNLSQLAAEHGSPLKSGSSSNPISLSQLAANRGTQPSSNSSSKPITLSHLVTECTVLQNSGSSPKQITSSHLRACCGGPQDSSSSSKVIRLSQLAADCTTIQTSGSLSNSISLSNPEAGCGTSSSSNFGSRGTTIFAKAADCATLQSSCSSPKLISLSQLAAGSGSPLDIGSLSKPISLSHLAADSGSPPNFSSLPNTRSLSHMATSSPLLNSGSSSRLISLSHLAAENGSVQNLGSSQKSITLSHLSPDDGTLLDSDTAAKCLSSDGRHPLNIDSLSKPTAITRSADDQRNMKNTASSPKKTDIISEQMLTLDSLAFLSDIKPPPGFKPIVKKALSTTVKRVPPGFEGHPPKPPGLQVSFNLSDLAAKHEVHMSKSKTEKVQKTIIVPVLVSMTRPSLFARILCSKYTAAQTGVQKASCGKFCYDRQALGKKHIEQVKYDIRPFDFSTPSPDDIVKTKQKAAFGISYTAGTDLTQGVARLTFSASKRTTMGFAEPDKTEETKEKSEKTVKEKGSDNNINKETPEKAANIVTETPKKDVTDAASSKSVTRSKREKQHVQAMYDRRNEDSKAHLNLVVIGHVDAGKSTMMGHVLYQLGFVNKKVMHKHEQEAKKMGKASFAYAWVLDETEEERSRGVTMDVAQTRFETDSKVVTLLDAPGHKDFIPNMITGAAQADVAILVVNATRGEFETGFDMGGQTREHAMLIRSLGVSQLLVAVNKMDTVDWSQVRYDEIVKKLGTFLKQTGFKEADVSYVPCSGLIGENLTKPSKIPELCSWYNGPCVVQQIDQFRSPERLIDKPLRLSVTDIFKGQGAGFSVAGTIQAGCVQPTDKVLVMPQAELATVKAILVDEAPAQMAFAGDSVIFTLVGIEMTNIAIGSIVCDRNEPIRASTRFQARVVIFNIDIPITKGFPVEVHYQSLTEPGQVRRLISQLHKSTGEVVKKKPRCATFSLHTHIHTHTCTHRCTYTYMLINNLLLLLQMLS
ncbi:hypothetical protein LSH36_13g08047 [Paralvinella palmiformis]|uniref:Tr-type G domain-containing protein n=1 Tax=Paralvinella palmiformis TaxID=53620 RepID=A0AAD9NG06_9ANNE|nr:hypothetical protein LSH36_13g08047 [Paralvinella palmiformis]